MATSPVFVVDAAVLNASDRVHLGGAEGRHAAKVRRIGVGEFVDLVDGAGMRAHCRVTDVLPDGLELDVLDRAVEPASTSPLVVVQALAKGDRSELAVEMLTEVGVDEIVPWAAARSVAQWRGDRGDRSLERWRATSRESAKQARRARFPAVSPLATTGEVTSMLREAACALVLHESAGQPLAALELPLAGPIVLVVGPEGGISPDEIDSFTAAGGTPVSLGPFVLRTSTAGVVAAALVLARTRDLPDRRGARTR